ncbi:MAG: hypothetical protein KA163_06080 [Bacteroidia bacterium]|nr:hypothetical protein [Bacteroidia bacterium]
MKKPLFSLALLFLAFFSKGQITVREVAEKEEAPIPVYDSLNNIITFENYKKFIGQVIYISPKSKLSSIEVKGYEGFTLLPKDGAYMKENLYKPIENEHKYNFITDYKALAGKYFKIIDILDQTDGNKFKNHERGLYLKLESKENRDIIYYRIVRVKEHLNESSSLPFILVGHFEKLKHLCLNKKFIAQKDLQGITDINTGKTVSCKNGSEWNCIDITTIETKSNTYVIPVFILKDSLSNEIAVGIEYKYEGINASMEEDFRNKATLLAKKQRLEEETKRKEEELKKQIAEENKLKEQDIIQSKNNTASNAAVKKEKRESLIKKYGAKNGSLIADGQVVIGMTKQMCIDAWGKPKEINRTTGAYGIHEQWVYNLKSYLYFENDILTTIQN